MSNYYLFGYPTNDQIRLGFQKDDTLYTLDQERIPSLAWLFTEVSAGSLITTLENAATEELPADTPMTLKNLLDREAIWASGVTYKMSEEARERESANSTIYTRVYHAKRPELFWKSMGYETVSNGDNVGIRADATWSVPEPELTLAINARGEVMGFTIGNDMSSRDIEGANPLYLPQAKVYQDACSLGPRIWLQPNADNWGDLDISIQIKRDGEEVFKGTTNTSQLNRTLPELRDYLLLCKKFPYGVLLLTGTGVVPSDDFTLQAHDEIVITIEPIGTLVNTVHVVGTKE